MLAYGVIALLAAALLELDGYRRGERKLWEYQAAQAKAAVPVIVKQGATTERVVTKYCFIERPRRAKYSKSAGGRTRS
jgi:hypothetical protein